MANAFNLMLRAKNPHQQDRYTITGRKYENARKLCNEKLSGENSPHYGIPKSESHRKNISTSRQKFIKNGGTSWNKGIPMSEATKEKLRKARKNQISSPDQCEQHSKSMTGRKKFNNGIKTIFVRPNDAILQTDKWALGDLTPRKPNLAKILICPYCNRSIKGAGNYSRYHNDNCKLKP